MTSKSHSDHSPLFISKMREIIQLNAPRAWKFDGAKKEIACLLEIKLGRCITKRSCKDANILKKDFY